MSFLSFTILILPPSHCTGCERLCGAQLQAGAVEWAKPQHNVSFSVKEQFYSPTQKLRAVFCKLKSCQYFCNKCFISTGKYLDFQHLQLHALLSNLQQRSSKRFTGRMLKNSQCPKDSLDQTTDILLILLCFYLGYNLSALPINIHLVSSARCIARLWGTSFQSSQRSKRLLTAADTHYHLKSKYIS